MKIVVVGGSGLAGSRIVARLMKAGHEVVIASRRQGVDSVTGAGVAQAFAGTAVVVDATAPRGDAFEFFTRSTQTLLDHGRRAGVRHHVVLSVVGADRMMDAPYMAAKVAQENLVRRSGIPFSIVRATQFHDFIPTLAETFTEGDLVRVPEADIQPVSVEAVARRVAEVASGAPLNGTIDVAGPQRTTIADAVSRVTAKPVVADADVSYFGARLRHDTLIPV